MFYSRQLCKVLMVLTYVRLRMCKLPGVNCVMLLGEDTMSFPSLRPLTFEVHPVNCVSPDRTLLSPNSQPTDLRTQRILYTAYSITDNRHRHSPAVARRLIHLSLTGRDPIQPQPRATGRIQPPARHS